MDRGRIVTGVRRRQGEADRRGRSRSSETTYSAAEIGDKPAIRLIGNALIGSRRGKAVAAALEESRNRALGCAFGRRSALRRRWRCGRCRPGAWRRAGSMPATP